MNKTRLVILTIILALAAGPAVAQTQQPSAEYEELIRTAIAFYNGKQSRAGARLLQEGTGHRARRKPLHSDLTIPLRWFDLGLAVMEGDSWIMNDRHERAMVHFKRRRL